MRVAWFTPLPPHRSGIAAYSADVLPALATAHAIDVYVDDGAGPGVLGNVATPAGTSVRGAFDFAWQMAQRPYDVVVYQLGNDSCHDYLWPYLVRYPGLVVMHDAQLHQARARQLLRDKREEDYVREFVYSHPEVGAGVPRLVATGLDTGVYYVWPMLRIPIESARLLAVHNRWLARELAAQHPGVAVARIAMGVPDPTVAITTPARTIRQRHGIPDDAVVFAAFGRVTPPKGLTTVLLALSQLGPTAARAHLLCVGDTTNGYDLEGEAADVGLGQRVHVTGYVADADLPSYLAAMDVGICLRWPTARETSASWLRCVAAGRPTIVHDLLHTGDIPFLDPRTMAVADADGGRAEPIAMGVDLLDEVSTLRLSLARLTDDPALRTRLGTAARRYWEAEATMARAARDYTTALAEAAALPLPASRRPWPAHLLADGTDTARSIIQGFAGPDDRAGVVASAVVGEGWLADGDVD